VKREIRVFEWSCDSCKVTSRVEGEHSVPPGWAQAFWYCDEASCTGHDRIVCPSCAVAREAAE
jgi:hypothetical protein